MALAHPLLAELAERGIAVTRDDHDLCVRAPHGALTSADTEQLRRLKPELLADLADLPQGLFAPTPEQDLILRGDGSRWRFASAMLELQQPVPVGQMCDAVDHVLARNDVFRMRLLRRANGGFSITYDADPAKTQVLELEVSGNSSARESLIESETTRAFDMEHEPPVRVWLMARNEVAESILFVAHHAALDRWSMDLVAAQLTQALTADEDAKRGSTEVPSSFAEAARTRVADLTRSEGKAATATVRDALRREVAKLDFPARAVPNGSGGTAQTISKDVPKRLRDLLGNRLDGKAVWIAALALALRRFVEPGGPEILRFGMPVSGRDDELSQTTVGLFSTTVPLHVTLPADQEASSVVAETHVQMSQAINLARADLRAAQDCAATAREFQVLASFQDSVSVRKDSLFVQNLATPSPAGADLVVLFSPDSIELNFPDRGEENKAIEDVAECILRITTALALDPERPVDSFDQPPSLMSGLRQEANAQLPLEQFLDRIGRKNRDKIALRDVPIERSPPILLSGAKLRADIASLASLLRDRGAGPEFKIGIDLQRGADRIRVALAILWAGAALVPLDSRRAGTGDGLPLDLLVTDDLTARDEGVHIERLLAEAKDCPPMPPAIVPRDAAAWILPTSGSTGLSKHVVIPRRTASRFVAWGISSFSTQDFARTLALTPLTFDISVFEWLVALVAGGGVQALSDSLQAASAIPVCEPGLINTTPSMIRAVLDGETRLPRGCIVNLAGEPLDAALVQRVESAGARQINNLYGPCEATTYSSWHQMGRDASDPVPIGKALQGWSLRLGQVEDPLRAPAWHGEIAISGDVLARGYSHNPRETAVRFRPDPAAFGAREYWTGDGGRISTTGELLFEGRADRQIKRRGVRIELDGIESMLRARPDIAEAAVSADVGSAGVEPVITAYVAPRAGTAEADFFDQLPMLLTPDKLIVLSSLPKTTSGKVDLQALSKLAGTSRGIATRSTIRTSRERAIAKIWELLLQIEVSDRKQRFFEIGGDSLKLMRMADEINTRFDIEVSAMDLLRCPTLADVARLLPESMEQRQQALVSGAAS